MGKTAIHVSNVTKRFDKNVIFEQCSLSIESGTVFGLVGLNGCGKTTFIRMLLGLLKPCSGSISVLDFDPWHHPTMLYQQCGVVLDHDGFAGNMTMVDNLKMFAQAKRVPWAHVELYIKEFWKDTFVQKEFVDKKKKVKILSRGQKMQCALCRAFIGWPKLFLCDEPTVALDVDACDHFYSLVNIAKSRGSTVFLSSHQLPAIEELCDVIAIANNKTVTVVKSLQDAPLKQQWLIRCSGENDSKISACINTVVADSPLYSAGFWHVSLDDPKESIPRIVTSLVQDGYHIYEIRQAHDVLKERLKRV